MKLILSYWSGDYEGGDNYCSFEHSDKELAAIELMELAHTAKETNKPFTFYGHQFSWYEFFTFDFVKKKKSDKQEPVYTYAEPQIMTLDEFFERFKAR